MFDKEIRTVRKWEWFLRPTPSFHTEQIYVQETERIRLCHSELPLFNTFFSFYLVDDLD